MSFITFLMGAAPAAEGASESSTASLIQMLVTFGLIFVVMYLLVFRPQRKKEQETRRMIEALKKGDKVVTIGGIHGVVSSTKEKTVIVKVDDGAKIEFNKTAISAVIVEKPAETKTATEQPAKSFSLFGKNKKSKKIENTDSTVSAETESEKTTGDKNE